MRKARILVFAPQAVSECLAGPSIRSVELARQLAVHFDTTLAVPEGNGPLPELGLSIQTWSRGEPIRLIADYDIVLSQGMQYPARHISRAAKYKTIQVFDLHNPVLFEILTGRTQARKPVRGGVRHLAHLTALILKRSDFLICATPQQRDFWLGARYALGLFHHKSVAQTGRPEDLVGVVPFGHGGDLPRGDKPMLKGVYPGIDADDNVILWGGGVWNWLDPETLIRAMAEIRTTRTDIKLLFLGSRHPNPSFREYEVLERAKELARHLGLLGNAVFFNPDWVPFNERAGFLRESDLAVCTAPDSLENHFSFRTRLVDAVWASVPIVCTRGGFLADFVEVKELGYTVRAGDVAELKAKTLAALEPEAQMRFRSNLQKCRDELHWQNCVKPLVDFCRKVELGEYSRVPERAWKPIMHYFEYKIPSLLESVFGFNG